MSTTIKNEAGNWEINWLEPNGVVGLMTIEPEETDRDGVLWSWVQFREHMEDWIRAEYFLTPKQFAAFTQPIAEMVQTQIEVFKKHRR